MSEGRPVRKHASGGGLRDPWLCCGCGNELLPDGTTGCDCPTRALFRMRDDKSAEKMGNNQMTGHNPSEGTVVPHARKLRHNLNDELPNGVGNTIAALNASTLVDENAMLREAVVALADGADKCAEAPHFIVQPFLAIYRKHGETIAKARTALSHKETNR